jgi:branched-chain amino acid transport system substrate-binding protein
MAQLAMRALTTFLVLIVCNLNCKNLEAETIKLGLLIGTNSILASEAAQIRDAVRMAQSSIAIDSSKNFKFEILEKDTKLNPDLALNAFRELTSSNKDLSFIIGPQSTGEVKKVAAYAEQSRIILISPSARSDDLATYSKWVFRTRHSQKQEAKFLSQFIYSKIGNSPLHTLILDSFAGTSYVQIFKPAFDKIGGKFGMFEDLSVDRPAYSQIFQRLKLKDAKNLFVISLGVQVADLMLEASDNELNLRFFGTSDNNSQIILERAGKLAEGFYFPYSFDPDSNSQSSSFAKDFQIMINRPADYAAANAYDAVMILSNCLEKVGSDSEAVRSCLSYTRNYAGAGGNLSFDSEGNASRDLFIKTVRNGRFVKLAIEKNSRTP